MPREAITIEDRDRQIDFVISVSFDMLPAEPELGIGQNVEINSVRCVEVTTWLGKRAVSAHPESDEVERRMGEHCLTMYKAEIEQALMEAAGV